MDNIGRKQRALYPTRPPRKRNGELWFLWAMWCEAYIEALDEELADQVWEAWDKGEIDEDLAAIIWWCIFVEGAVANANYDFIYKTSPNQWRL